MSESDDEIKELLRQLIAAQLINSVYSAALMNGKHDPTSVNKEHTVVLRYWRELVQNLDSLAHQKPSQDD